MKHRLITALVALSAVMVFARVLYGGSTVIQVTDNYYDDSLPQIKGDYVVWQGKVNETWEIFVCNIQTPEAPIRITDNAYDDVSPQTDGHYVVWLGYSSGGGEIFLYDVKNGEITQITDDNHLDSPPRIADGMVVWASQAVTDTVEPGEIFLYLIATGVTQQLTDNALDDRDPQISSETIMWIQADADENTTLFVYEIATGITAEAPEGFVWEGSPQVDGELTVLIRHDGLDGEVFLLNGDSRRYHQVSDNDLQDDYPSISGNHLAWMAAGEIFIAEYEYLGLLNPAHNAELPLSTPPPFVWEAIGYEGFKVSFSGDPTFSPPAASVFPSGDESWTFQTSFSPTEEQWEAIQEIYSENGIVYWRVEGRDLEGSVSYTETRKFTIDEPSTSGLAAVVENADDMTVSSGTSCFIGTLAH